jgi:hypothetical protein
VNPLLRLLSSLAGQSTRPDLAHWARVQADALAAGTMPDAVPLSANDAGALAGTLELLDVPGLPEHVRGWARDRLTELHLWTLTPKPR